MNNKYHIILILSAVLFFLPFVRSDNVYKGTHYSGDSFIVNNITYSIIVKQDRSAISSSNFSLIVKNDECNEHGSLIFCIDSITYKEDDEIYTANLNVEEKSAILNISRSISNSNLHLGETTDVSISIKNVGNKAASDIYYLEPIPSEIEILRIYGQCTFTSQGLIIKGSLEPDNSFECVYTITGKKSAKYDSNVKLSYFDGIRLYSNTSTYTINILDPELAVMVNKSEQIIGNDANITILLRNNDNLYPISIGDMVITMPPGLMLKSFNEFKRQNNLLTLSLYMPPKTSNQFTLVYENLHAGNITINVDIKYEINKFYRKFHDEVNYELPFPNVSIVKNVDSVEINDSDGILIEYFLVNYDDAQDINNIDISLKTNIPELVGLTKYIKKLDKKERVQLISLNFSPSLDRENYYINMTIYYSNLFGQKIKLRDNEIINALKNEELDNKTGISISEDIGIAGIKGNLPDTINESKDQPTDVKEATVKIEPNKQVISILILIGIILIVITALALRKWKKQKKS